jgi:hypothetical protein
VIREQTEEIYCVYLEKNSRVASAVCTMDFGNSNGGGGIERKIFNLSFRNLVTVFSSLKPIKSEVITNKLKIYI